MPTTSESVADPLSLVAEDETDLVVLSSLLQDAVLTVGDMTYLPRSRRFALVCNRYVWEQAGKVRSPTGARTRTGVHFDLVTAARTRQLPLGDKSKVASLLHVAWHPVGPNEAGAAGGAIDLLFADEAQIRLEVEAISASLTDLSGPWAARRRPQHKE